VIRALIVDDEPLACARLRRLLSAQPDIEVVGECVDGTAAIAALAAVDVDLVMLDIEMPEADGFDVAGVLESGYPAVVFVTAHEEYARRAFDADAVDYLLKPVDADRIAESLARVRRRIANREAPVRIPARIGKRIRLVAAGEIDWIEAQGNYSALHVGDNVELIRETMTSLERRLDPAQFTRIHRGIIVRIDRIRDLSPRSTGEYTVRMRGGVSLLSGRTYRARLAALVRGKR
jgi:two-component system, LytTR family, response regulator